MKILQISKFYQPVRGGIETVAWELAEGLSRLGLRSDVLCSNQRPVTELESFPGGYDVLRAASLGMLLSTSMAPAMVTRLPRLSRDRDIIHVHMPDPMAALAVSMVRPRARIVLHWHSDVVRQRRAMRFYEPLQRWLLRRADAILTTSAAYAETSVALQPWRSKVTTIPIGISDNLGKDFAPKTEAIRQQFSGRRIVFALGRMTYYKGFEVLIEAAAALPDDCVVLIGGGGALLEQHRAEVRRRGLGAKLHLLGHVNDGDLPSYFQACDVFCMTSTVRAEAYGVAMLEAMAMGKPVVATDIAGSGVPWVNVDGHTGFNTPVGQAQPLAQALMRLLDDVALRGQMGAAARERYLQQFSAESMTSKVVALYERLLLATEPQRTNEKTNLGFDTLAGRKAGISISTNETADQVL